MRITRIILVAALALPACDDSGGDPFDGNGDDDPGGDPDQVTYWSDVKPILDARCNYCHYEGGIAPFALTDFASAQANAGVAVLAVNDKIMPPWPANPDCRDYLGDRSLSDDQIATLGQWLADGTPEGDPTTEGAPLPNAMPSMSRVDATLEIPPYTPAPPGGGTDDYRCFVIPWPAEYAARTYVTGFNAVPDNDAIVHHVIAFVAGPDKVAAFNALDDAEPGPGYTCFGGANGPSDGMIAAWAPGSLGEDLPAGIGLGVEPGSVIILQIHYNTLETTGQDQTAIQFKIDEQVEREGSAQLLTNPFWPSTMTIPANDPDVTYSFAFEPTPLVGEVEVFSAGLHMHTLGVSGNVAIQRASGDNECLLQIDDWNFHWQGSYRFAESTIVRSGDKLAFECRWDNSQINQPIINGEQKTPTTVTWGESTTDEMCITAVLYAPAE